MKEFTIHTLEAYAEIVRLIGQQSHTKEEEAFFWSVAIEDSDIKDINIWLHKEDETIIVHEVDKTDKSTKSVSYDAILAIMGYASSNAIKLDFRAHLYIPKL